MADQESSNATVTIDHADDLSSLVRDCVERQQPIVDYGIAHAHLGYPPPPRHVRLVQRGAVIEHYDRDMTLRAAAGATMGELNEHLRSRNQFLPIDADSDLTLGEVICHNVYGPLRATYGAIRDLLLGLRYVDGLGRQIHVGGRTVKNVAGYDLSRFMVGSLGQFGVVYEATIRTYSIPHRVFCVELQFNDATVVDALLGEWLLTDAAPGWMLLKMTEDGAIVRLGYFGRATACEVQVRALESMLCGRDDVQIMGTDRRSLGDDADQRGARRRWRREATGLCKVIVPPACTGALCKALSQWAADHALINVDALPVHGCVFAGGTIDGDFALAMDQQINQLIDRVGGRRVWYRRPEPVDAIDPYGPAGPDLSILGALKHTMDPNDLLNPGRFVRPLPGPLLGSQEELV